MKTIRSTFLIMLFVATWTSYAAAPSESIYQLHVALTNQDNKAIKLDDYRDQVTLVTMFYGSCPNVCPLLIETLQSVEKSLDAQQRTKIRVMMVSIDPDRDTPAALTVVAKNHRIDTTRWTLARASASDVRKLAAVLNIQYRKLPNGEYNHSSAISLLDVSGRKIAETSKLGSPDGEFIASIKKQIGN